jgi:beta-1,4-N-acetylglucosaminyltransferase
VSTDTDGRADLLLVCSTGGHLQQLLALRDAWGGYTRVWVTFDKSDARSLLRDERVVFAHGPTNRSVKNLFRNLVVAWRTLRDVRPQVVLTTGAGVAVPFAWVGRLRGARLVYVESFTRIDEPSLTCRLVAPVADRIYAQWPELVRSVPKAHYAGTVFKRR